MNMLLRAPLGTAMDGNSFSAGHTRTMSKHHGETPPHRRLTYLIETADECHIAAGGYRLRLTRSNTTLLLVMGAIDANPALRFQMTMDETGVCWVDVAIPGFDQTSPLRETSPARPGTVRVVA